MIQRGSDLFLGRVLFFMNDNRKRPDVSRGYAPDSERNSIDGAAHLGGKGAFDREKLSKQRKELLC